MLLTAQHLLTFQRCPRQVFLDVYGDMQQKAPPSDFLKKLTQDRIQHQNDFFEQQNWIKPQYPAQDWLAGAQATLALMQKGADQIRSGVLLWEAKPGLRYMSTPDLLTKVSGVSSFGDWLYVPTDIKLSKRPKLEYQILVAFHAQLLAEIQGGVPPQAFLYLRDRGWYSVDLPKTHPKLMGVLQDLEQTLEGTQTPEVFIVRNRCSLCGWFNHCYGIAQAEQHLSLLPGVTPSRYPILASQNLHSVEALAHLEPVVLQARTGFTREVSTKLVYQAQAFVQNQPIALHPPGQPPQPLPTAPIELYFDIEAEPSLNLAYLHGVLVVDRAQQTQTFYPLLAKHCEEEAHIWYQFLELVHRYPDAPIFHFCAYEVQTVERLAAMYPTAASNLECLIPRFVDLHDWITRSVTLPIENYTLKLIARWLGFHWRNAEANGAQSIYWYGQWLETQDPWFLETIVTYNEDDCRATYHVKDWLTAFLHEQNQEERYPHTLPSVAS
ncbi:TM0106 family RecB-like putative nuclease [Synechococcales cyanobacterium C]|uniref:TM0106 family RecB-like putative nuclease n=1 Tax=Petrachloros mirabilis ULC683 TaxID=2781853 RepID=A0A8K1ZXF9_9CYAN|nr:TM0106 family RecB-like putative nuclease [Petrachloros mirabilis]NCJ05801.1 TM0106 family RecB-like putative nuclease [Petrachloros mirabilis ULC683]